MNANEIIKELIKRSDFTQTTLARAMGYSTQSGIASRLNKNDMGVSLLVKMLDILGYDLVIQPKKRGRKSEDQFFVEPVSEE